MSSELLVTLKAFLIPSSAFNSGFIQPFLLQKSAILSSKIQVILHEFSPLLFQFFKKRDPAEKLTIVRFRQNYQHVDKIYNLFGTFRLFGICKKYGRIRKPRPSSTKKTRSKK